MAGHALLDAAVKVCGSRYKVAKALGVSEAFLSKVHAGTQGLSPEMACLMAALANLDPVEAAKMAIIDGAKTAKRREALERALFPHGAVATLLFCVVGGLTALVHSTADASTEATTDLSGSTDRAGMYIMLTLRRLLRRVLTGLLPVPVGFAPPLRGPSPIRS